MVEVSVIIHTRNEATRVPACLESCIGWASEVLVADMESSDATTDIAETAGARVINLGFESEFDRARNASAEAAGNDWILYLDADERLTDEIKQTIEECLARVTPDISGFNVPFRVHSFGQWIEHAGGWWPSYKSPPLLRKGKFHFPGGVHQPAVVEGRVVRILPKSPADAIEHYSHDSLSHYIEKLNRYTDLEVAELERARAHGSWQRAAVDLGNTLRSFYDYSQGDRDGTQGFLLSFGSAIYDAVTQLKLLERSSAGPPPRNASDFLRFLAPQHTYEQEGWVAKLVALFADEKGSIASNMPMHVEDRGGPLTAIALNSLLSAKQEAHLMRRMAPNCFVLIGSELPIDEIRPFGIKAWHRLVTTSKQTWWFSWANADSVERSIDFVLHQAALDVFGGGEVQVFETVRALRQVGVLANVYIGTSGSGELTHVFSLHSPVPQGRYLLTPIYWDRQELKAVIPQLRSVFEYCSNNEEVESALEVLRRGMKDEPTVLPSEQIELVRCAKAIFPNAQVESDRLALSTGLVNTPSITVANAVRLKPADPARFHSNFETRGFVLCVGRLEWNKNQVMLLYALRDSSIPCVLIGDEFDSEYAQLCRRVASPCTYFLGRRDPDLIWSAYAAAAVHCLPSFGETPGLSNLEAAAAGCPLVVSNRGAEREYFESDALYCDPLSPSSIREKIHVAIANGRRANCVKTLQDKIISQYSWETVAAKLKLTYEEVLGIESRKDLV